MIRTRRPVRSKESSVKFIMNVISYRIARPVTNVIEYAPERTYYSICPRCKNSMERDYTSFCDRCGQKLNWDLFEFAKVVTYSDMHT